MNKGISIGISIAVILGISLSTFALFSNESDNVSEADSTEESSLDIEPKKGRDLTIELNEDLRFKGN